MIEFGDHATILRFSLSWWNVKREEAYPAVTSQTIVRWIREGKAHPDYIPGSDAPRLQDWTGVKTVTVKHARLVSVGEPKVSPSAPPWRWRERLTPARPISTWKRLPRY